MRVINTENNCICDPESTASRRFVVELPPNLRGVEFYRRKRL
jgi:hypothetical protein